jgi:hypothetical protein
MQVWVKTSESSQVSQSEKVELAFSEDVATIMQKYSNSRFAVTYPMELDPQRPYQVHDLLSGARYLWHGVGNYIELNPNVCPAHIFRVNRRIRRKQDFDYYM